VKTAVETYQRSKNLNADGVAGAATMDAMGAY
jgi:murein L,D-transpeptidase YcbB/YkuD